MWSSGGVGQDYGGERRGEGVRSRLCRVGGSGSEASWVKPPSSASNTGGVSFVLYILFRLSYRVDIVMNCG